MKKTIYSLEYEALRGWLTKGRMTRGLTQRKLAELLDVPSSLVAKVELGERRLDLIEFLAFCKALDVDPHEGIDVVSQHGGTEPHA